VKKYSLLFIAFVLVIVLWIIHFLAMSFYFYWTVWWLDNVAHFLAGLAGGFIVIWFFFDSSLFCKRYPTIFESILSAFTCVLIVGVMWEIFEYVNDLTQSIESYVLDTVHDLIADLSGAIFAGIIGTKEIFRKSTLPPR